MASFFHRQALHKRVPIVIQLSIVGFIYFVSIDNIVVVDGFTSVVSNNSRLTTTTKTEPLSKRVIEKAASSQTKSKYFLSSTSLTKSNCVTTRTQLSMSENNLSQQSTTTTTTTIPSSWEELRESVGATAVGTALNNEVTLRSNGYGSAHVQNKLRLFPQNDKDEPEQPVITLFRDHAGWCPYCQKTMLLIEEKQIPIKIDLVPMRSYGDKPREFLQKVPSGLLPAIEVNGRIITESQVIMELLDQWHPPEDGYKPMLPNEQDKVGRAKYDTLARLERELFSWWCTLVFRPDGPSIFSGGGKPNVFMNLLGGGKKESEMEMSSSMQGFLDCVRKVDDALLATPGPWFFGEYDHPTMIDFVFVSHVERMLASCAFWKGLNLRDPKWELIGLNRWLEAFEKREAYVAFKSDYYTHIKDIPPQYGPGYDGGFDTDRIRMSNSVLGTDGSWSLPLSHDDPFQPLYTGPPLPIVVLESMNIQPDSDGSYQSCDPMKMSEACRLQAGWKLASNGLNVAKFASRGGPTGSKNPRKTFGAELADPYANPDDTIQPIVDVALRIICSTLIDIHQPVDVYADSLRSVVPKNQVPGVISSLQYLRDRIGVPRDLPLASARYLRAHLNWGIDTLSK